MRLSLSEVQNIVKCTQEIFGQNANIYLFDSRVDDRTRGGDMKSFIPLTSKKYQTFTKDEVQDVDKYLFRFSKLQDTMGDKVFKAIIKRYDQNSELISFADLLNKLEKYRFIDSSKEWTNLRKIRNIISHQYDDEPEKMAQAINNLINQKKLLKRSISVLKIDIMKYFKYLFLIVSNLINHFQPN